MYVIIISAGVYINILSLSKKIHVTKGSKCSYVLRPCEYICLLLIYFWANILLVLETTRTSTCGPSTYIPCSLRIPPYLPLGCKSYRMCRPVCAITAGDTVPASTTRHGTARHPRQEAGDLVAYTSQYKKKCKASRCPTSIDLSPFMHLVQW